MDDADIVVACPSGGPCRAQPVTHWVAAASRAPAGVCDRRHEAADLFIEASRGVRGRQRGGTGRGPTTAATRRRAGGRTRRRVVDDRRVPPRGDRRNSQNWARPARSRPAASAQPATSTRSTARRADGVCGDDPVGRVAQPAPRSPSSTGVGALWDDAQATLRATLLAQLDRMARGDDGTASGRWVEGTSVRVQSGLG